MPMRHRGRVASRASIWPRDHFCRSTIAPRSSWPTTWNEFLPISIPITSILLLSIWDMACSFVFGGLPVWLAGRAGARPDHPILRHWPPNLLWCTRRLLLERCGRLRALVRGEHMRRREVITLIGGAAAWPSVAQAQQGERIRRIGVLMHVDQNDRHGEARLAAFAEGLKELGWIENRNLHLDVRWGPDDPD